MTCGYWKYPGRGWEARGLKSGLIHRRLHAINGGEGASEETPGTVPVQRWQTPEEGIRGVA